MKGNVQPGKIEFLTCKDNDSALNECIDIYK